MSLCSICGASLPSPGVRCDYDVPVERAPGIGDPEAIVKGRESHGSHEVHIARWRVHHPDEKGATAKVMAWARERLLREGHVVPPA